MHLLHLLTSVCVKSKTFIFFSQMTWSVPCASFRHVSKVLSHLLAESNLEHAEQKVRFFLLWLNARSNKFWKFRPDEHGLTDNQTF